MSSLTRSILPYLNLAAAIVILIWAGYQFAPFEIHWDSNADDASIRHEVSGLVSEQSANELVNSITRGEARVLQVFPGPAGWTGVVIGGSTPQSKQLIGWTNGSHLLVGPFLNGEGVNLTKQASLQYIEETSVPTSSLTQTTSGETPQSQYQDALTPDELYAQLQSVRSITQFDGDGSLYVFYDSGCTYCQKLHQQVLSMRDFFKKHNVGVKWIPVGLLSEQTHRQGQAHLQGGLEELNRHFSGEISQPLDEPNLQEAITHNTLLLRRTGKSTATPTLVYRSQDGVRIVVGAPRESQMKQILREVR